MRRRRAAGALLESTRDAPRAAEAAGKWCATVAFRVTRKSCVPIASLHRFMHPQGSGSSDFGASRSRVSNYASFLIRKKAGRSGEG